MHVAAILKTKGSTIITTKPEERIATAAHLLSVNRIGALLVMDADGKLAGILSERDIVRALAEHGAACLDMPVRSQMTQRVVTCTPCDTVESVMQKMTQGRFRHLPVMDGERLTGFISIGDVVKHRLMEVDGEMESLRDYVAGRM